jgi:hypothetical protein
MIMYIAGQRVDGENYSELVDKVLREHQEKEAKRVIQINAADKNIIYPDEHRPIRVLSKGE